MEPQWRGAGEAHQGVVPSPAQAVVEPEAPTITLAGSPYATPGGLPLPVVPALPATPVAPPTPDLPVVPATPVPVVPATPVPVVPATVTPIAAPTELDDDATVVVHRRRPPQWRLVLEDGTSLPLDGNRVLVGRKPSSSDPATVALPIPDSTMTMSKIHALLERVDDHWTITDLGSTNGVMLIQADGAELYLSPGTAAPLTPRFVLGKVTVSLYQED